MSLDATDVSCNRWGHTPAITGTGDTHVCQCNFNSEEIFQRVRKYDVSFLCGAPTMLNRLITSQDENRNIEPTGNRDVGLVTAGSAEY